MSDILKFLQGGGDAEKAESKRDFEKRKSQQAFMIRQSGQELFKMRVFQNIRGRAWRMGRSLAVSVERIQHHQTAIFDSLKVAQETLKYHDKGIKHV